MPKNKKQNEENIEAILSNGVLLNNKTNKLIDNILDSQKVYVKSISTDDLSTGVAINTYEKTSLQYLKSLKEFSYDVDNIKEQIRLSNKVYKIDGTVSTAVDVLVDFVVSSFDIDVNKKYKPIFNYFSDNLNKNSNFSDAGLYSIIKEMALEWFLSGNVFPYSTWKNIDIDGNKVDLPYIIQLLNPLAIEIPGMLFENNDGAIFFNSNLSTENQYGKSLINKQLYGNNDSETIRKQLVTQKFQELSKDRIYHLKRKTRSYDVWGIPYLVKTFNAISTKMKLRALDNSTTEGMINMLTIFKIGSEDVKSPYHIVSKSRLNAFANLIKNPQASTMIAWAHDIDVITAGPKGEILDFENKYKEVDEEIIRAVGVPRILLDGSGTATAGWVAILSLMERLERVRESIQGYVEYIFNQIMEKNKFENVKAKLVWSPINLRDEKTVKTLLMGFYDRGLLPIETTLREGGYKPDELILKMEKEKNNKKFAELFKRRDVPFSPIPKESGRPSEKDYNPSPTKADDIIDQKYSEDLISIYFDNKSTIVKKLESFDISLLLMKKQMNQLVEAYIKSVFPDNNVFAIKVSVWNGKYLDKFITNLKTEIGVQPDKYRVLGVFDDFEKRLNLFCQESLKKVRLAELLDSAKKGGKVGAYIKTNPNTECDSCKSISGNFYILEEILDVIPIHPNNIFDLEFTDTNEILDGKVINTPVQKHPKDFSKIL